MDFQQVSVIGVGLIGGSFALSLKKAGFQGSIYGVGRNRERLVRAKEMGIVDECFTSHAEGVHYSDLIFLSAPVGQFPRIVQDIRGHIQRGAIVTDAGSVKAQVIKELDPLMPEGVSFVGGHPIAGKECSGAEAASADLFDDARCVLTPGPKTDRRALERVDSLWKALGARTVCMDPDVHDAVFAAVSHMPHVVSYALINAILEIDRDFLMNGGKGLRDMTRIALSPPELWRDICAYNKTYILRSLRQFMSSVSHVEKLIEKSDWDNLRKEFEKAQNGRQTLESD